jgi:hypothetical protein
MHPAKRIELMTGFSGSFKEEDAIIKELPF